MLSQVLKCQDFASTGGTLKQLSGSEIFIKNNKNLEHVYVRNQMCMSMSRAKQIF